MVIIGLVITYHRPMIGDNCYNSSYNNYHVAIIRYQIGIKMELLRTRLGIDQKTNTYAKEDPENDALRLCWVNSMG